MRHRHLSRSGATCSCQMPRDSPGGLWMRSLAPHSQAASGTQMPAQSGPLVQMPDAQRLTWSLWMRCMRKRCTNTCSRHRGAIREPQHKGPAENEVRPVCELETPRQACRSGRLLRGPMPSRGAWAWPGLDYPAFITARMASALPPEKDQSGQLGTAVSTNLAKNRARPGPEVTHQVEEQPQARQGVLAQEPASCHRAPVE